MISNTRCIAIFQNSYHQPRELKNNICIINTTTENNTIIAIALKANTSKRNNSLRKPFMPFSF